MTWVVPGMLPTGTTVLIRAVLITPSGKVTEHLLGYAEGLDYPQLALAVERLLEELANTWPEVLAEGVT